jgi:hypothetical protein
VAGKEHTQCSDNDRALAAKISDLLTEAVNVRPERCFFKCRMNALYLRV